MNCYQNNADEPLDFLKGLTLQEQLKLRSGARRRQLILNLVAILGGIFVHPILLSLLVLSLIYGCYIDAVYPKTPEEIKREKARREREHADFMQAYYRCRNATRNQQQRPKHLGLLIGVCVGSMFWRR